MIIENKFIKSVNKQLLLFGLIFVIRFLIGCLFIYGSLSKIRQPYDFLSSVYAYEMVGPKLGMFIAITLPWLELLVGICLIGGIFISGALLTSAIMGAIFTFILASVIHRGLKISCGCFGGSYTEFVSYFTVVRAFAISLFSIMAYMFLLVLRRVLYDRQPDGVGAIRTIDSQIK